ncbi:hypothetical protein D5086_019326 [Populus alba]|uniref:Uncharacterized protein n=1 Tax=Populus alba TaxID=43335 RepID=A0ACC4BIA5_POPAL
MSTIRPWMIQSSLSAFQSGTPFSFTHTSCGDFVLPNESNLRFFEENKKHGACILNLRKPVGDSYKESDSTGSDMYMYTYIPEYIPTGQKEEDDHEDPSTKWYRRANVLGSSIVRIRARMPVRAMHVAGSSWQGHIDRDMPSKRGSDCVLVLSKYMQSRLSRLV